MGGTYTTEILPRDRWAEWDHFVDRTPQGTFFHRSAWLTTLVADTSFLVCRDKSGAIAAGLPLIRRPVGWYNAYRPGPLSPYAGLVLSEPAASKRVGQYTEQKEKALALLDAVPRAALLMFALHPSNPDAQPFVWHGYTTRVTYTYCIEAPVTKDDAWDAIDPKQRNMVRKAQKQGVTVRTADDIEAFLPLIRMTFERQGIETPLPDDTYRRLWQVAKDLGQGAIYIATANDGTPEVGQLVVWDPRSTYHLLGGGDPARRGSGAGSLALWQAIQDSLDRGQTFNFEGSTLFGIERHYRRWGGRLCPIIYVEKVGPLLLRMLTLWRDWKSMRKAVGLFQSSRQRDEAPPQE